MKLFKSLIKILIPPKKTKKSKKKGGGTSYRDYGREAIFNNHDIIKGVRLSCALDEKTCLKCLELDGTVNPPKLPIHKGCRCITIPITKTWKELGVKNAPYEEEDVDPPGYKLQKEYLIERAKAIEKGLEGDALANHLKKFLPSLERRYPKEQQVLNDIKAKLFALQPVDDVGEIETILKGLSWHTEALTPLFKRCAELNRFDLIDNTIRDKIKIIPTGLFDRQAKYNLYRAAANSAKKHSLEKAIEYNEQAFKINDTITGVIVELGALYRRVGRTQDARMMLEKALKINPNHKGAKSQLEKL